MRTADYARVLTLGILLAALLAPAVSSSSVAAPDAVRLADYPRTSWADFEGLSLSGISAIVQDQHGYMWFGGGMGLIRGDGARYVRWNAIGPPIPEGRVSSLLSSRDGSLWVGFGYVGAIARIKDGHVRNYMLADGVQAGSITAIVEDQHGTVWAGGSGGLMQLKNDRWERQREPDGVTVPLNVIGLIEDQAGTLWLATPVGIFKKSLDSDNFAVDTRAGRFVRAIVDDPSGATWIDDSDTGARPLEANKWRAPIWRPWPRNNAARLLFRDRKGDLWVAVAQGLFRVHGPDWSAPQEPERLAWRDSLAGDTVLAVYEDRERNLWVGTTAGLTRVAMSKPREIAALPQFENKRARVIAFATSGEAWVGSSDGLYRWTADRLDRYDEREGLPGRVIGALHQSRNGTLWVSTENGIASFADGRFKLEDSLSSFRRVRALTSDSDDRLWLCDVTGVYVWEHGTVRALNVNTHSPTAALTDSSGRVWVGFTPGGITLFDRDHVTSFSGAHGLPDSPVSGIQEDANHDIWVMTTSGLSKFADGHFLTLTKNNGLPDDAITARIEDDTHNVWLGTSVGIIRIGRQELARGLADPTYRVAYRLLDASDGFETLLWAGAPTSARSPDGRLWFIARNGVIAVDPQQVGDVPMALPVRVERFIGDGRIYAATSDAHLPPSIKRLEIEYTNLSFAAPSKLRFRYMLDGFDRDWVLADTRRQVSYTNLTPGQYRFRVSAANVGGAWNQPTDLAFVLQPTFYQTRWFYSGLLLTLTMLLIAAWRYRVHRLRQRYVIVLEERARVGREIHDTLLQGMVGAALQLQATTLSPDVGPIGKQRLERARDCLEHYIRETRSSIWALRSPLLEQQDFTSAIEQIAKALITDDAILFDVTVESGPVRLDARTEEHLLRIAHEAISNALRHATPRRIEVHLVASAGNWLMRVSDDGVGFEPTTVSSTDGHWGLRTMRERAQMIGATLNIESGPTGTCITVGGTSA
jgi:ligand-binding sensor domain-containing protein